MFSVSRQAKHAESVCLDNITKILIDMGNVFNARFHLFHQQKISI